MPTQDDQEFLDWVFERIVERLEDEKEVCAQEMLDGREHLRGKIEELILLGQRLTLERQAVLPRFRDYAILEELGHGGMGSVYLARQEKLGGRLVALKVLPAAAALSSRARERFRSEARTIAGLRHRNIVSVYDVVEQDGAYAYAMEWIEGSSLARLIDHVGKLGHEPTVADVAEFLQAPAGAIQDSTYPIFIYRLGVAIARSLAVVHEAGLLHRDIKPSNILLHRDGTPRLSDFGLVRDVHSPAVTQPGQFAGTPAYAAPEQLRGDSYELDARSDIYSLGATLYHALALRVPFAGRNSTEILRRIETGAAPPLRRVNPRLPADLQTIIGKAMDPQPARRYQSAAALADDLERLLRLQPILAKPAGKLRRVFMAARRNRTSFIAASLGAVVVSILATTLGMYLLWLPGWVQGHLAQARLALLNPVHGELVFMDVTRIEGESGSWKKHIEAAISSYEQALIHYDRITWTSKLGSDWQHLRLERETVALALDVLKARQLLARGPLPGEAGEEPVDSTARATEPLSALRTYAPKTLETARSWCDAKTSTPIADEYLSRASRIDLRHLGLLAFLCGDAKLCNLAWSLGGLDMADEPDALVDGALGQLHLASDRPDLAYPRLDRAFRAFPQAGYLAVDLASAAIERGDLDVAGRLLERAKTLRLHDAFDTLTRVQADFHAARDDGAQGDPQEAERLYRWMLFSHEAPTARSNYARFLSKHGRPREACCVLGGLVTRWPELAQYRRTFVDMADDWWVGLTVTERLQTLVNSFDEYPLAPDSLASLLRTYLECREFLERPEQAPSTTRPISFTPKHSNLDPATKATLEHKAMGKKLPADSSPFFSYILQRLNLTDLANKMEVNDMNDWSKTSSYPRWLKGLRLVSRISQERRATPWLGVFFFGISALTVSFSGEAALGQIDKDFEFDVDGVLPSADPDTVYCSGTGQAETSVFSVSDGILHQTLFPITGVGTVYAIPNCELADGPLNSALSFSASAGVKLLQTAGDPGAPAAYVQAGDGVSRYSLFLTPSGPVLLCAAGYEEFPAVSVYDFHVYRLESPGSSSELRLYIDGALEHVCDAPSNTFNAFEWGGGNGSPPASSNAEWHFVRVSNPSECEPLTDCNNNGLLDACDIADDTSVDCDGDFVPDECELDTDSDGIIDACESDIDNDGVLDVVDTAPSDPNICIDSDSDGCDDCAVGTDDFGPLPDNDLANDGQDTDADGLCDQGDGDDDNDGVDDDNDDAPLNPDSCADADADTCDDCAVGTDGFGPLADNDPSNDGSDADADCICDAGDNCPAHANTNQADCDDDGLGDVCAIANGVSPDCNANAVPDECDIDPTDPDGNSSVSGDCHGSDVLPDDCGGDDIPDECFIGCMQDLNGDGLINASDLALLLGAWGSNPGHCADFNCDGMVNASDLALLLGAWGVCLQ